MTSESTPTLVAVYHVERGGPHRVAEFSMTTGGEVALKVIEPDWSDGAIAWYEGGIGIIGEPRWVLRNDGPAFMRALLQPFRMSYFYLVDESEQS
ncbi:hypothetical protein ACQPXH_15715 [Nocardia sp. CA-135953]|uniref:hypothetical protein n=1 Tax=Nocardia sp. CA-135953 TaxID=3239978 RepID=UPI003D95C96A